VKTEEVPANQSTLLSDLRKDAQQSKKRPRAPSPPPENVSNGKYVTALTGRILPYSCGGFLNAQKQPIASKLVLNYPYSNMRLRRMAGSKFG
jgi:hypothetical protein